VEVDAKYIKGMLKRPDLQPNTTMNQISKYALAILDRSSHLS